jgi:hypothetical protein
MTLDVIYISELNVSPNGHYSGQGPPVLATTFSAFFPSEDRTSSGGSEEMLENLN